MRRTRVAGIASRYTGNTMQKWTGVRASALLALLGSLLTFLIAGATAWAGARPMPADLESSMPLRPLLWTLALLLAVFGVWGMASAIGVFRRRNWARLSMIIFACLLVGMGGSALVGMLFIQIPASPSISLETLRTARIALAAGYGAITVIGAWWLLLFNSSETKQYFATTATPDPGARPLSISIIGWFFLLHAVGTAAAAILRVPGTLFGWIFAGWAAMAIYTALTALQIYLGTGLLQLQEPARVASIVYFGVMVLNSLLIAALPGYADRVNRLVQAMPAFLRIGQPLDFEGTSGLAVVGSLCLAVPIWFLVRRRAAFGR